MADATVWAKQLVDGYGVELWQGGRFVVHLDATGKPEAISHKVTEGRMVSKEER